MGSDDLSSGVNIPFIGVRPSSRFDNDLIEGTFHCDSESSFIDLRMKKIREIDLRPLSHIPGLEEVHLGFNQLRKIDLSPLANCPKLRVLDLGIPSDSGYHGNYIEEIDITSLSHCSNLVSLNLSGNNLRAIDLAPLSKCRELRQINLRKNPLTEINLSSLDSLELLEFLDLSDCDLENIRLTSSPNVTQISLDGNRLNSLNLAPLANAANLSQFDISDNPLNSLDITPIVYCFKLNLGNQRINIQRLMLNFLDFTEFFGYDGDLLELLRFQIRKFGEIKKPHLYSTLVCKIEKQIETGGPTLFLDIQKMSTTSAASIVPRIVRRRIEEVNETVILVTRDTVDLKPLWLTDYGFMILSTIGTGLESNVDCLDQIHHTFSTSGMELRTTDDPSEVNCAALISVEMREFVLSLANTTRELEEQLREIN